MERVLPRLGVRGLKNIWEPACGLGHMSEVLKEYCGATFATDIHAHGAAHDALLDFLDDDQTKQFGKWDWIITNPPFGRKTVPFVLRALEIARIGVAMFLRSQWIVEGGNTCQRWPRIFRDNPPTLIAFFTERVNLCKGRWDPDGSTATAYCWVVWLKGARRRPPFWIPPGQRRKLTRPDDRERFA